MYYWFAEADQIRLDKYYDTITYYALNISFAL